MVHGEAEKENTLLVGSKTKKGMNNDAESWCENERKILIMSTFDSS